jgi:hypothetical protein
MGFVCASLTNGAPETNVRYWVAGALRLIVRGLGRGAGVITHRCALSLSWPVVP